MLMGCDKCAAFHGDKPDNTPLFHCVKEGCNGIVRRVDYWFCINNNYWDFNQLLNRVCVDFNCDAPEFRELAAKIYAERHVLARKKRGWAVDTEAVVIYSAMVIGGQPCTKYDGFLRAYPASRKYANRYVRAVKKMLGFVSTPCVRTCAVGICDRIQDEKVRERALDIITRLETQDLLLDTNCRPSIRAAGIVYMASQEVGNKHTQKEIAEVCGITEVSIRNAAREFGKQKKVLREIYEEWKDEGK